MPIVDIHSHILPAIDDGSQTLAMSLEMLAQAVSSGTTAIVATPHETSIDRASVHAGVSALQHAAHEHGLPIQILTGSEVRFDADLAARFRDGSLATINDTQYVLIELSLRAAWSPYVQQAMYDLQLVGATPILAHAERYPAVQKSPDVLLPLINQGVLIQVNSTSISRVGGRASAQAANALLRRRMAHVLASDAHDTVHRPPIVRPALQYVTDQHGATYSDWIADVAVRIIAGDSVNSIEPIDDDKAGIISRLFRRR